MNVKAKPNVSESYMTSISSKIMMFIARPAAYCELIPYIPH